MLAEGAALLDLGAESTRPGASPVSEQEELDRLLPVLEAIAGRFDTIISRGYLHPPRHDRGGRARGAGLINDVRSLTREGALTAAVATGLPVCLMHMQGQPVSMQQSRSITDVVAGGARLAATAGGGMPVGRTDRRSPADITDCP